MKLAEMFDRVNTDGPWITAGLDVQYRLEILEGKQYLFFQCSKSWSDWMFNFDFPAQPYKDTKKVWFVHQGFLHLWKSVQDQVMGKIDMSIPLVIVGYSEGSALGLFAHEDYQFRSGHDPEQTVLFGCPRTIWMSRWVRRERFAHVHRVSGPHDMVTHVPFALWGFRHCGIEQRLTHTLAPRPRRVPLFQWLSGHCPQEYEQRLAGL